MWFLSNYIHISIYWCLTWNVVAYIMNIIPYTADISVSEIFQARNSCKLADYFGFLIYNLCFCVKRHTFFVFCLNTQLRVKGLMVLLQSILYSALTRVSRLVFNSAPCPSAREKHVIFTPDWLSRQQRIESVSYFCKNTIGAFYFRP